MSDRWDWLEEIESKMDPELSPFAHEQLEEHQVVKLIACIKEMRQTIELYERGLQGLHPEIDVRGPARQTLNRCAKGEFK